MAAGPRAWPIGAGATTVSEPGAAPRVTDTPEWCQVPLADGAVAAIRSVPGERATLTAFRDGSVVGRAALLAPSGDAAVASVSPLGGDRPPGLVAVLVEHLAAAARRQGFTALLVPVAGDPAALEVLGACGLAGSVQPSGAGDVLRLSTAPTDRYLRTLEEREVASTSRWFFAHHRPGGKGPSAVVVPSARARAVLDTLRVAGVADPLVVTVEAAGDSRTAVASLAGDDRVEAIGLASAGAGPQARLAALSRHVGRTKTFVVVDGPGGLEGVWAQPGVARVRSNLELGRIFSHAGRLRRRPPPDDAGWSGHLAEVGDLDPRAARAILASAGVIDDAVRAVDREGVDGLLGAYGVDAGRPVAATVVVEARPGAGLAATVTVGRAATTTSRPLPLTEQDLRVLTTGVGPREARQHLQEVLRRTARLVDDQAEVVQVRLGPGREPSVAVGPARPGDDDPWVRRLPEAAVREAAAW